MHKRHERADSAAVERELWDRRGIARGESVSRHKGKPPGGQWGRVARWAGIGNNGEEGSLSGSGEGMAEDTMVKEPEEKELTAESAGGPQAADAGSEVRTRARR